MTDSTPATAALPAFEALSPFERISHLITHHGLSWDNAWGLTYIEKQDAHNSAASQEHSHA